jgi:hypothetical protein
MDVSKTPSTVYDMFWLWWIFFHNFLELYVVEYRYISFAVRLKVFLNCLESLKKRG